MAPEIADECSKTSSCLECVQKPGCGWCSSPEINLSARCSSRVQNEDTCPPEGREKKYDDAPVVKKWHSDLTTYMSLQSIQLRPKHVEMGLNVGEIKTLPFTYRFNGPTIVFSYNLPDHVELKIFSNCGQGEEKEVDRCTGIRYGVIVKFNAQFRLKYCPKDASLWKGSYQIHNSDGGDLDVDLKLFCACSCDKHGTENTCRNDKKVIRFKMYASAPSFIRVIWMSTHVQLKIHAPIVCVMSLATGVPVMSILIQMDRPYQDAMAILFLQAHFVPLKQG